MAVAALNREIVKVTSPERRFATNQINLFFVR